MRLHLGAIPNSPDFVPDGTWKPMRELSPWLAQLIALPIGIAAMLLLTVLWFWLTPLRDAVSAVSPPALFHVFLDMPIPSLLLLVIALVGLTVIHELLHAVVHPMKGLSPRTVLGFWPSTLMFYAHYDGEVSRNRLIAILLTPLIIISIVPLVVAAVVQVTSGWAAFLSCFNAVLSCVDMLGVAMLLFQVPRTAVVRNQGWKSYWKVADPATA
ncbi:MAG: DUF3267 domain-containing protein [Verrucomicrobiota bacterium]